jgi:hypothetical protein
MILSCLIVSRKTLRAPSTTNGPGDSIDESISGLPAGRHRTITQEGGVNHNQHFFNQQKRVTSRKSLTYLSRENYKGDQQPGHQIPKNDLHVASQPTKNDVHLKKKKAQKRKNKNKNISCHQTHLDHLVQHLEQLLHEEEKCAKHSLDMKIHTSIPIGSPPHTHPKVSFSQSAKAPRE